MIGFSAWKAWKQKNQDENRRAAKREGIKFATVRHPEMAIITSSEIASIVAANNMVMEKYVNQFNHRCLVFRSLNWRYGIMVRDCFYGEDYGVGESLYDVRRMWGRDFRVRQTMAAIEYNQRH